MLREDFQAVFARLSGVLQGDVGDQSLAVLYFQGDFFLQRAFMPCNVWDVLAPLQHWDYKFYLRRGGADRRTDTHYKTHTSRNTLSNKHDHLAPIPASKRKRATRLLSPSKVTSSSA